LQLLKAESWPASFNMRRYEDTVVGVKLKY
jgi:hypothetical protein